nr:hypothetical protein [Tanacetum cinerariifolium]
MALPEDMYAAVDSCETAQEIWLCVHQMMKGIANQNRNGNVVVARVEGIQLQDEEFNLMDTAGDLDEIEEVNKNCILMANLQQALISGTQTESAPVNDPDGPVEISYDKAYNDMQQKFKRLQAQLGDLKGKSKDTLCVSDTLDPLSQKLEDENVALEF